MKLRIALETLAATAAALASALSLQTSIVWLVLPLVLVHVRREPVEVYGLSARWRPPSALGHLFLLAAVVGLYSAGRILISVGIFGYRLVPRLPEGPVELVVTQLLVVALPEEFFFRGYLQARWNRITPPAWSLFGARIGPAILVQAVAFALCHVAAGDWTRSRVFLFALLAGWLRERTGGILAPAVYHALGNFCYWALEASLVRRSA